MRRRKTSSSGGNSTVLRKGNRNNVPFNSYEYMNDQDKMPFGKFKGEMLENVPASYLLWLWNEGVSHEGLRAYISDSMSALQMECPDIIVKK